MKVAMNNTIIDPFYGRINYDLSEGEQKLNPNVDKYVKKSGSTSLENVLKNNVWNPNVNSTNKDLIGRTPKPSVGKYKFLNPYTVSFGIKYKENPIGWGDGHKRFDTIESKSFTFSKGDIINSESSTFNPSSNVMDWDIFLKINDNLGFSIPQKNILQKVDDSSIETQYKKSDFPNPISLDKDDKIIKNEESVSKYSQNKNESFFQKHKNHLLIAVVLVAGYLAYKKFKN